MPSHFPVQLPLISAPDLPGLEVRRVPRVWVTILAKVMVGDLACPLASWLQARYQNAREETPSDRWTAFRIEHTHALTELVAARRPLGERTYRESANYFELLLPVGVVLVGKGDLVSLVRAPDATVFDVKTGRPSSADPVQVRLYQWALPRAIPRYRGLSFTGQVVYPGKDPVEIPPAEITTLFEARLLYFANRIAGVEIPDAEPSSECEYCSVASRVCRYREEWALEELAVEEECIPDVEVDRDVLADDDLDDVPF